MDIKDAFGRDCSLVLGTDDRPYISCQGRRGLLYLCHDGEEWRAEVVEEGRDGEGRGTGLLTSLVLDVGGNPHIGYFSDDSKDLRYAHIDGVSGQWIVESVDSPIAGWHYTSLALRLHGDTAEGTPACPMIAYYDHISGHLNLAFRGPVGWHVQVVDSNGEGVGQSSSLALDKHGRPHIAYYVAGAKTLRYAHYTGAGWEIIEGPAGVNGHSPCIQVDPLDCVHIVLSSYEPSLGQHALTYLWRDPRWKSGQWHVQVVDETDVAFPTCLALGSQRKEGPEVHIAYYDYTNRRLKYAWRDPKARDEWQKLVIEQSKAPAVGLCLSLALGSGGRPHISYYDRGEGERNLKLAVFTGEGWETQVVLI